MHQVPTRLSRWVLNSALLASGPIVLAACETTIPPDALALRPESLQERQLQSRRFETIDEKTLLKTAAGLLQDMGYNIEESEVGLGVIVGSKQRDATDTGEMIGAALLSGLLGSEMLYDSEQQIRVSIVTRPSDLAQGQVVLRATFQRIVWNNQGGISKRETVSDVELYQDFFDKLSKAAFLQANDI